MISTDDKELFNPDLIILHVYIARRVFRICSDAGGRFALLRALSAGRYAAR